MINKQPNVREDETCDQISTTPKTSTLEDVHPHHVSHNVIFKEIF